MVVPVTQGVALGWYVAAPTGQKGWFVATKAGQKENRDIGFARITHDSDCRRNRLDSLRDRQDADATNRGPKTSESPCGPHVLKVAEVIIDADVVQYAAKTAQGNTHAVRPTVAAELPAAFEMRFEVEEHAG